MISAAETAKIEVQRPKMVPANAMAGITRLCHHEGPYLGPEYRTPNAIHATPSMERSSGRSYAEPNGRASSFKQFKIVLSFLSRERSNDARGSVGFLCH
jgi:hypothetical protein